MATRISPNKIAALAKVARAHGISKLAIPGLRLEFAPVEPVARRDEPVVRDSRKELKTHIAEQLGGVDPDDVNLPSDWSLEAMGVSIKEEIAKVKATREQT
jgi:hypothetical protein